MRLVNDKNAEVPFYVGNCKNNIPPKHVAAEGKIAEGAQQKPVTIAGEKAVLIKSAKSADYIYIQRGGKWEWVKDVTMFDGAQTTFVEVPKAEKAPKEPKEPKAPKAPKGDTAESIGLDVDAKYNVYGTEMSGADAKKRFGLKNIKDGLAAGKITLVGSEAAATEAAAAGETGAA